MRLVNYCSFYLNAIEESNSVPQMISAVKKRLFNPNISNMSAGNRASTSQTRNIIITMENRFKVITLRGKVIKDSMGLTKIDQQTRGQPDQEDGREASVVSDTAMGLQDIYGNAHSHHSYEQFDYQFVHSPIIQERGRKVNLDNIKYIFYSIKTKVH